MMHLSIPIHTRLARYNTPRIINGAFILFILGSLCYFLANSRETSYRAYVSKRAKVPEVSVSASNVNGTSTSRILKLSMLYGEPNTLYERALRTHEAHAIRWNHSYQILRQDLATGFWNKPTFLLNMLTQELMKPAYERAEWLMYTSQLLL